MPDAICWFCERHQTPRWLAGFDYDVPKWTDDPHKAIRFQRECDAATLCGPYGIFSGIGEGSQTPKPSEHVFVDEIEVERNQEAIIDNLSAFVRAMSYRIKKGCKPDPEFAQRAHTFLRAINKQGSVLRREAKNATCRKRHRHRRRMLTTIDRRVAEMNDKRSEAAPEIQVQTSTHIEPIPMVYGATRLSPNHPRIPVDLLENVAWAILSELHTNVPEDKRPMSWSDLSDEQAERIRRAAGAAIEITQPFPELEERYRSALKACLDAISYESEEAAAKGKWALPFEVVIEAKKALADKRLPQVENERCPECDKPLEPHGACPQCGEYQRDASPTKLLSDAAAEILMALSKSKPSEPRTFDYPFDQRPFRWPPRSRHMFVKCTVKLLATRKQS
jgi:hypothetical protein